MIIFRYCFELYNKNIIKEKVNRLHGLFPLVIFFFISLPAVNLFSAENDNILLRDIARKIDAYRDKEITLRLRFKNIDYTFEKITFYDRKNIDIAFDVSRHIKDKKFKQHTLNLHEGMEYNVNFIVKDVGNNGDVLGDLISFTPLALLKLPDGNKKGR